MGEREGVSTQEEYFELCQMDEITNFRARLAADNRSNLYLRIQKIVDSSPHFPKEISLIWDDRFTQHTSHVILTFHDSKTYSILIDNTHSPTYTIANQYFKQVFDSLDFLTTDIVEKISDLPPHSIQICHSSGKTLIEILLTDSPSDVFKGYAYASIDETMRNFDWTLKKVDVRQSRYNAKGVDHSCVALAVQNKLDYITGRVSELGKTAVEAGFLIRAQQAILSYLLTGKSSIPYKIILNSIGEKLEYPNWYLNYEEVCSKLNAAIEGLSFGDLQSLYLA